MIRRYRTPESVKKRIDYMLRKGEVILDHGIGSYEFDHYDYDEASWENDYKSALYIWYRDFDANKTVKLYMKLTEDNLRKPEKYEWREFVDCYWEKKYPTLLYMREYDWRC